jgi:hypothetical protein
MGLILRKETTNVSRYKLREEYKDMLMAIEALPGVNVTSTILDKTFTNIKEKWNGILIFLHIEESTQEGLFFLTRCLDRRYWEHGDKWRIELEVGDVEYPNGDRPITYMIFRPLQDGDTEQNIIDECKSLIHNMNEHFNHDGFMNYSGFSMNKEEYHFFDETAFNRRIKLENLGL